MSDHQALPSDQETSSAPQPSSPQPINLYADPNHQGNSTLQAPSHPPVANSHPHTESPVLQSPAQALHHPSPLAMTATESRLRTPSASTNPRTPTRQSTTSQRRTPYSRSSPSHIPHSRPRVPTAASPLGPIHMSPAEHLESTRLPQVHDVPTYWYPASQHMHQPIPVTASTNGEAYETMMPSTQQFNGQETADTSFAPFARNPLGASPYSAQTVLPYPPYQHQQSYTHTHLADVFPYGHVAPSTYDFMQNVQSQMMHQQQTGKSYEGPGPHGNGNRILSRRQIEIRAEQYVRNYMQQYARQKGIQQASEIPNGVIILFKQQAQAQAYHEAKVAAARQQHSNATMQYNPTMSDHQQPQHTALLPSALPSTTPINANPQVIEHVTPLPLETESVGSQDHESRIPIEHDDHQRSVKTVEKQDGADGAVRADMPASEPAQPHGLLVAASDAPSTHQRLRYRLQTAIAAANNAYAQRASHKTAFDLEYPRLQLNVVTITHALLANATGLDVLASKVWTANDDRLAETLRGVSPRLKHFMHRMQNSVRAALRTLNDPELKWTAASKSLTMFYDSFSGLKAAILEREKRAGEDVPSFTHILDIDRKWVWQFLGPDSDDELAAVLSAESAMSEKQTSEVDQAHEHEQPDTPTQDPQKPWDNPEAEVS